jgi:hypothetical protein
MTAEMIRAAKCQRTKERNTKRKKDRQLAAAERQAAYDALSSKERIKRLDRILGKNKGATKERARLNELVAHESVAKELAQSNAEKQEKRKR